MRILLPAPVETPMLRAHLDIRPDDLGEGHGGTIIADLALALGRAGHEVTLITLDDGIDRVQTASGPHLTYVAVPMRPDGRGKDLWRHERRGLARAVAAHDADIINAHWTFEYAAACLEDGRPLVVTAHDWPPAVLRHHANAFWLPRLALAARVMAARPLTTTPSPAIRDRYRRFLRQDVALTPNGIPMDVIRRDARTPPAPPVVLSVANGFAPRKNTSMLLQSWPQIRARAEGARLRLLGDGHGPGGDAQRWGEQQGIDLSGVEFVGGVSRDDVLAEMAAASVLAHPAREEPFGMVVIEAMAQGTPVVAAAGSGGPPHILDHGRFGPVVNPDAPAAMAGAVAGLLRDPSLWMRRSSEGLARVATAFSIDAAAAAYIDVYEQVLAGGRAA